MLISTTMPLLTVLLTLAGGWLITTRVSDRWDRVKKVRELDLTTAQEFQSLYGEFFSIWKVWSSVQQGSELPSPSQDLSWDLLKRASAMEGRVEALLAKVCAERLLTNSEVEVLGSIRQAFQQLRETIQENEDLPWYSSDTREYMAFKSLAAFTSGLLARGRGLRKLPTWNVASANFRTITDNRFEYEWVAVANRECHTPEEGN